MSWTQVKRSENQALLGRLPADNKSDKKDFLLIPLIHFVSPFKRLQRLLKTVSSCTCGNVYLITFAEQSCYTDSVAVHLLRLATLDAYRLK